jgi:hypothetical protein
MRSHTDVRSSFTTRSGWPRSTPHNLARAIAIATGAGYARADDEAHTLIRTALAGSGDIIPDHDQGTLHIRLDPLPAPRHATHRNFRKSNPKRTHIPPGT